MPANATAGKIWHPMKRQFCAQELIQAVQLLIETQHAHTGGVDPAVPCQNIQARQEHENEIYYLFLESPMIALGVERNFASWQE